MNNDRKEYLKNWQQENKDKTRENAKRWYYKNIDKIKEKRQTKEYKQKHTEYQKHYRKTKKQLLDYITNLQEENERLHKELDYANNDNIYYIAKIDKAVEYGKELRLFDNESLEFEIGTNFINILQGEDNEN